MDTIILPYVTWNDMLLAVMVVALSLLYVIRHAAEATPPAGRMSRKRNSGVAVFCVSWSGILP